jgi:predicted MPP superfamily phosphohydrolase
LWQPCPVTPARALRRTTGVGLLAGAAVTAYALGEARAYTLRSLTMPVLPTDADPLRVLHLSDLHLTPSQSRKREWVRSLAALEPDLVVNTGDNLAHLDALPTVVDALGPLLDVPGVFVLGSNDYFAPILRNPLHYLLPDDGTRNTRSPTLPWQAMIETFEQAGWTDLSNTRATTQVRDLTVAWAGLDDPHLDYDDLAAIAGPADASADLRVGVTHAPYLRVLDQLAADAYDAIFAGHTHGGQVCLPLYGTLVTNCDLEPARARGLHRHPADSRPGDPGSAWLHVSAGLGTSPYAPIRVACRPEATLLTLVPAD